MKIIIVGGGASGLLASIAIKEKKPKADITLIDKNNKFGKKLRATGNGKANILNIGSIKGQYLNEERANALFKNISLNTLLEFFHSHHIKTINYGNYVYPYSESANAFTETLINEAKKLGVKFISETKALDYQDNILLTDKGNFPFDKLVIATGLGSSPQLGGDASFVNNLLKHSYDVIKPIPALAPLKTIEATKIVEGNRRKVHVKVIDKTKTYLSEDGELLFKKDGLSGIVIYHVTSICLRHHLLNPKIVIDFLPQTKFNGSLNDYFPPNLAQYLKQFKNPKEVVFHLKGFYDAKDSVASVGGVSLDNVDDNFASKIEKNVYIIGEALNQDGLCGGFNLMWAFATALKVSAII